MFVCSGGARHNGGGGGEPSGADSGAYREREDHATAAVLVWDELR